MFSVPAEHVMLEIMANVFIIVGIVGDKLRSKQIKDRGDHGWGPKSCGFKKLSSSKSWGDQSAEVTKQLGGQTNNNQLGGRKKLKSDGGTTEMVDQKS